MPSSRRFSASTGNVRWFSRLFSGVALVGMLASSAVALDAWAQDPNASFVLEPLLGGFRNDPLVSQAAVAVQVVNVRTGDEVWSLDGDRQLAPASVMKVVTSAAALRTLGPTHRFTTEFLRDGEVNEDGVLEGNLYFKGGGDPTLVIEQLWKMFQDLQVEGIVEIDGDLIFDDTYFDREHLITGWDKKVDIAAGPSYFAPISAISLNFNTASIVVAPGFKVDDPARVQLETPASVIEIQNELKTVPAGKKAWTSVEREIDPKTHVVTFKLEGAVPLGSETEKHYRSVGSPVAWTMSATSALLKQTGIKLNGRFKLAETPDDAKLVVRHYSQPLHEILNHTNKYSSNFMAEHVLKAMGAERKGAPGTTAKGVEVLQEYLDSLGIPRDSYVLVNGSGLSRDARMAPSQVNAVMMDMFHHPAVSPEFLSSLAVGGVDGTLRRRYDDEPGAVRGKTGSLNGVLCLTSYIRAKDGETYAMTIFSNDLRKTRPARALQDGIGEAIMGWTGKMPDVEPK